MDLVVVGSCVQDLVSYTPRFPKPGESVRGHKFVTSFGGKGANQAVQAAKLGAKVAFVGKVGQDVFGPATVDNFKSHGVDVSHLSCISEAATATATITVSETGENSIVVVLGACEHVSPDDVQAAAGLIQSAKYLLCQLEIPVPSVLAAFKLAKASGVQVIFNPAPGLTDLPDELFQYVDVLCPNENEAELLTGDSLGSVEDAIRIADKLAGKLQQPGARVLITLGPQGCVLKEQAKQTRHIQTTKVDAVDTTGAGDSFVGSLAYFLSYGNGLSFEEAVSRSLRIATISVQAPGTQISYPPKSQLPQELFQ